MKLFAPAKINLYLHILGRRPDGFHELETLMIPISCGDDLEISLIPEGMIFTCSDKSLVNPAENLATRAAILFLEEFELETGVQIHLEKRIPIGAGLGGGSSNAAAVLLALRELCKVDCDNAKLRELASRLGSDIPFFIDQAPAICKGRGEIIEPTQLTGSWHGLLIHPGFGVSTPWSYQTYAKNPGQGVTGKTVNGVALRNDLELPAFSKYPWLPAAKSWLQGQPEVVDALMSGSGSSLFALTHSEHEIPALRQRFVAEFGAVFAEPFTLYTR